MTVRSDDLFDSVIGLEDDLMQKGLTEGKQHGEEQGMRDGFELGHQIGFELGVELGYYQGFVKTINHLKKINEKKFSERCLKSIHLLETLLKNFEIENTRNENLQEQVEKIRATFKLASTQAKLYVKPEKQPLSF